MLKQKIVSGTMQEDTKGGLQELGAELLLLLQGRQGSVNPVIAKHIGRAHAGPGGRAQNVGSMDTGQNGVKMTLSLHQILNKPRLLEKTLNAISVQLKLQKRVRKVLSCYVGC